MRKFKWKMSLFLLYLKEKFWFLRDRDCDGLVPRFFLPLYWVREIGLFLFVFYFFLLSIVAVYSWFKGSALVFDVFLRTGFWVIVFLAANFALGVLYFMWEDLVSVRRNEKLNSLTIMEVVKGEVDFERWCC